MKVEKTNRGFEIVNFKDYYDVSCSLQQSSIILSEEGLDHAGSSAIWFGTDEHRMHLIREHVEELIPFLQNWLKTGSFALEKLEENENA